MSRTFRITEDQRKVLAAVPEEEPSRGFYGYSYTAPQRGTNIMVRAGLNHSTFRNCIRALLRQKLIQFEKDGYRECFYWKTKPKEKV